MTSMNAEDQALRLAGVCFAPLVGRLAGIAGLSSPKNGNARSLQDMADYGNAAVDVIAVQLSRDNHTPASTDNIVHTLLKCADRMSITGSTGEACEEVRELARAVAHGNEIPRPQVAAWRAHWPDGTLAWVRPVESWDDSQRINAERAGLILSPLYP